MREMPRDRWIRDHSPRTHEYRTLRLNREQVQWLSKIAQVDTAGHGPNCICTACRLRRELEDK